MFYIDLKLVYTSKNKEMILLLSNHSKIEINMYIFVLMQSIDSRKRSHHRHFFFAIKMWNVYSITMPWLLLLFRFKAQIFVWLMQIQFQSSLFMVEKRILSCFVEQLRVIGIFFKITQENWIEKRMILINIIQCSGNNATNFQFLFPEIGFLLLLL